VEAQEQEIDEHLMQLLHFDKGVLEICLRVFFQELMEDISVFFMLNELLDGIMIEFPLSEVSLEFLLDISRALSLEVSAHDGVIVVFLQEILFECAH